jgi:Family of unknown function (DUF6169)
LPNHYEITSDEQGYFFSTDLGLTYRIVFEDVGAIFQDYPTLKGRVFSYSFYPASKPTSEQKLLDQKVRHTIAYSINSFFEKNDDLIVFVCDSLDKREMCRKKLFDRWFAQFNEGMLEKYDGSVESDDIKIITSLILKNDLYDKEYVVETFKKLNDQFSRVK